MKNIVFILIYTSGMLGVLQSQNVTNDSVIVVGDDRYGSRSLKDFFMGHHYRDAWLVPLKVPYIDIEKEGLIPIKQGGGVQTTSLRLKKADGTQYVFRSVKKDVSKKLPLILQETLAKDILQDQISASHPYGALIVPPLAQAAGISYSIPQLVVVKDSPALGDFRETFGNMLVLFEQRPAGDLSSYPNYDHAPKVVSTPKVLEKIHKSLKNQVDGHAMARARLFDFWIGDIDRHDDQWRWGAYEIDNGTIYRPIPRDRDFAFLKADGLIPMLGTRKWAFRMAKNFNYEIDDVAGLAMQGMYVDRTFITQLTKADWIKIAESIKQNLSDSIIDQALSLWPDAIYKLNGEEIKAKLKSRREHLTEYAEEYYLELAKKVDILGSENKDHFLVERLNEQETRVRIFRLKKNTEVERLYFDRTFQNSETKEIRLYGFNKSDEFEITGKVKRGIKIRVIGGTGSDKLSDNSEVEKGRRLTLIYDKKEGIEIESGPETKDKTRKDTTVNLYDRKGYKYNVLMPLISFGFNPDDGLFLGGGALWKKHGFRKYPFASQQKLSAAFAIASSAFLVKYEGVFTAVLRKWDLHIDAQFVFPKYTSNFYGLGNESQVNSLLDNSYYVLRYDLISIRPSLQIRDKGDQHLLKLGSQFQFIAVDRDEIADKFVETPEANLENSEFKAQSFGGLWADYSFNHLNQENSPSKGWRWRSCASWQQRLNDSGGFFRLSSEFSAYLPIEAIQSVIAFRVGGSTLFNKFEFYQANSLGGQEMAHNSANLRGYRRDRFVGRSTIYQNTEIRIRLAQLRNYILPFELGLIAFIDSGRVWLDGEDSSRWHSGYGGGVTLSPTENFVLTITYDKSIENEFLIVGTGFRF